MKMFYLLFCAMMIGYAEDPWGRDASLVFESRPLPQQTTHYGASLLIRGYQKYISPINGPRSAYDPTSSEYTRQAMLKYGFVKGFLLGCDRLLRENDDLWVYDMSTFRIDKKYDPVR